MTIAYRGLRKPLYVVAALVLGVAAFIPALGGSATAAGNQVTARNIKMSSSNAGATPVSYEVNFTPGTSATAGAIIVDFCANSPIIGDTSCTLPTSFNLGGASPTVTTYTGMGTGWAAAGVQGGASAGQSQVLRLTNTTPQALATGTPVSFTITSVTNPNADNTTFFARILVFDTAANATSQYTASSTTRASTFASNPDYGGVALSTGKVINITARVMENISFCVYKAACTDDPSFTLGHGANNILDTSITDDETASFSLSTNAQTGATIRLKGDTLKTPSGNDINPAGATAVDITNNAGTERFGVRISTAGSVSPQVPYDDATNFGFDVANTTSTYGDDIATLAGPVNNSVTTLTYAATAGNTTAAGIYTAAHQLIATGQF